MKQAHKLHGPCSFHLTRFCHGWGRWVWYAVRDEELVSEFACDKCLAILFRAQGKGGYT